jgi:hypothetical protein
MSGVTVMALVVASCSSSSGSGSSGSGATTSSAHSPAPTTSAQPLKLRRPLKLSKQPSARRAVPHANATLVRFNMADGIGLDGAMVGAGTVGVVLAHEYDNDLCGAWPFANYPRPCSESLVAYGTMALRSCGPRAATRGLDAQMPSKHGPGCVRRRCLRCRWRSWVVATATAEVPDQEAGNELAVAEVAGKYAVQGGLIGDGTITSFGKIARGPIYRAEGAEVFSGRPDVQRDRSAWAIRYADCASAAGSGPRSASGAGSSRERARTRSARAPRAFAGAGVLAIVDTGTGRVVSTFSIGNLMLRGPTRSRAGRRRLHRDAGVLVDGRSSGRRGDGHRAPACHRGLARRRDSSGIG